VTRQKPRPKPAPATYHRSAKPAKADYRNIAIPNTLHKEVSHIAIDADLSVSEIVTRLVRRFCSSYHVGERDAEILGAAAIGEERGRARYEALQALMREAASPEVWTRRLNALDAQDRQADRLLEDMRKFTNGQKGHNPNEGNG